VQFVDNPQNGVIILISVQLERVIALNPRDFRASVLGSTNRVTPASCINPIKVNEISTPDSRLVVFPSSIRKTPTLAGRRLNRHDSPKVISYTVREYDFRNAVPNFHL
jgi:hypothetical protein